MTAPYFPTGPQRPRRLASYNPIGTNQSTFKPLVQSGSPAPAAPQTQTPQPAPQPAPQTFAQMQAAGQARPAPPPPAPSPLTPMSPAPRGAQSFAGVPYGGQLNHTIGQALANPSAYGSDQVQTAYQRLAGEIDDEFAQGQQRLGEQMAARGLSDSSINAGRLSDLNIAKRSAKTDLADRLMQQMAQTYGADRAAAIAAGLQGANQANAATLDWARLGQQGEQFGQDLGLRAQLGLGQLGLGERAQTLSEVQNQQQYGLAGQDLALRQQLGLGELGLNQQRLAQEGQLSREEMGLRQAMQQRELTAAEQQQLRDLTSRREMQREQFSFEGGESAAERAARLQLQQNELGQQREQFGQQMGFQNRQLDTTARQSDLDRQLRERLGLGELGINQQRLGLESGDLDLRRQLGMGNLDLSRQQLSENSRQSDLDRQLRSQLGLGELDLNRQQLTQQGQQFQSDLALRDRLGTGELGLNRDRLNADTQNQTLERQLRERLGLGELDINQQRTNNDLALGQNQLLGSVFNALMNGNVDLSKLPPDFVNQVLSRATGPTGSGSGGGSTGGLGSGRPPGWWRNPSGVGAPVTGTPAGPVSTGSSPSVQPYTPQGRPVTPDDLNRPGGQVQGYIFGGKWYPDVATALQETIRGMGGV